jgi:hypothetical protein
MILLNRCLNRPLKECELVMSNSWYTPKKIIADARYILGSIDLDPASCERAQRVVQATKWIGLPGDGTCEPWKGLWWCNPPYSEPELWVPHGLDEHLRYLKGGSRSEGLFLLPTCTGTKWWTRLWDFPIAWIGRLKFWGQDVDAGSRQDISMHLISHDTDIFHRYLEVAVRHKWHVTVPETYTTQSDCV